MIRLSIIDDEKKSRDAIREIVKANFPDNFCINEVSSVREGVAQLEAHPPELVLLDINLIDGSAFDLLGRLKDIPFKIIFITAYDNYAVKAFKFSAIDYLLKPIIPSELITAVQKAVKSLDNDNISLKLNAFLSNIENISREIKKIVLKTSDSVHLLNLKDIIRLESDSNYTRFYLAGGKKLFVSKTLKDYEDMLEDHGFFRPHQSHMINLYYIDRFEKCDGGYLIMNDGTSVPVSHRKKERLMKIFNDLTRM